MLYNCLNILNLEATPLCIVQKIALIFQKAYRSTGRYLKRLREGKYLIVNTVIFIEAFPLLIVKHQCISLKGEAIQGSKNVYHNKNSFLEDDQVLYILNKYFKILIENVFTNGYYLAETMYFLIEVRVIIVKVDFFPIFYLRLLYQQKIRT